MSSLRTATAQPGGKTEGLKSLIELSSGQDPRLPPTWLHLAETAVKAGLRDVQTVKQDAPGYLAFSMHECNLVIHKLVARATGS
ncbi:hypothetical protein F4808DRAFT_446361 [Astrocystis sublimbata]|nr:hypothetical protein F4808DRAFT_446361 [Astrocystis sublimbata]